MFHCVKCGQDYQTKDLFLRHPCMLEMQTELTEALKKFSPDVIAQVAEIAAQVKDLLDMLGGWNDDTTDGLG